MTGMLHRCLAELAVWRSLNTCCRCRQIASDIPITRRAAKNPSGSDYADCVRPVCRFIHAPEPEPEFSLGRFMHGGAALLHLPVNTIALRLYRWRNPV